MGSEQFTPGPWKVFGLKSRNGDYTVSTFNAYGPQRHIAYAAWASDQGLADAHLIAAAPDLFEALQGIVADDDAGVSLEDQRARWNDRMAAAKAAIAKAAPSHSIQQEG